MKLRRRLPDVRSIVWIPSGPGSVLPSLRVHARRMGLAREIAGLRRGPHDRARGIAAMAIKAVLTKTYAERTGAPRRPGDGATGVRGRSRPHGHPRLAARRLAGWVALKLRAPELPRGGHAHLRDARASRTLLAYGAAGLLEHAAGAFRPSVGDDDVKHEDRLDLQGGAWVLRTSRAAAPTDPVDRAGPGITFVALASRSRLLLFALLRLRRPRRARREEQGAGPARQGGAVPGAGHLVAGGHLPAGRLGGVPLRQPALGGHPRDRPGAGDRAGGAAGP